MDVVKKLKEISDEKYACFQASLIPTIDKKTIIGVRLPKLRLFAKEYEKIEESKDFIQTLPHTFYDENMLHGLLLSTITNYDRAIFELDKFLPYVDNWAVCDVMFPKVLRKNKERLIVDIKRWISSKETYTIRFGIDMLMRCFLDEDFKEDYLYLVVNIISSEYYVNMAIAWFFATALTKQWDSTIAVIESKKLDKWLQNKSIQKAIESYRIPTQRKNYLRSLKI